MWPSRNGRRFLVLITVLFAQTAGHVSKHPSSSANTSCQLQEVQFRLGAAIDFANKAMESLKDMKIHSCPSNPEDCDVLLHCGKTSSGVYTIWPKSRILDNSIEVYCDMKTDGGGWTVIQRRGNFGRGEDYFFQDWNTYKQGFGNLAEDFWLGNDNIFGISNQKKYAIRFDLMDGEGEKRWAEYDHFWIDSEDYNYTLHVNGYKGNAGDSFSYHSGQKFSTNDRDNDQRPFSCANVCKGAWWYKACYQSNLNALYLNGLHEDRRYQGINWVTWRYDNYSLPFTEMKIRPSLLDEGNSGGKQCSASG